MLVHEIGAFLITLRARVWKRKREGGIRHLAIIKHHLIKRYLFLLFCMDYLLLTGENGMPLRLLEVVVAVFFVYAYCGQIPL